MKSLFSALIFASILLGGSSYIIYYPRGKTMESVVHLSGSLYLMSDYVTGNVMMADTRSRQTFTVVTAPANRTIQGLEYVKKGQLIVTCGGGAFLNAYIQDRIDTTPNVENVVFPQVPTGINVYNLSTGTEYVSCPLPNAGVINDVVLDRQEKYAYFSDTKRPVLYRMNLLDLPACKIVELPLPKADFTGSLFQAGGLAYYKNGNKAEGVIIANYSPATFHFYDIMTGKTYKMGSSCGSVDGLRNVRNRCLLGALNIPRLNKYRIFFNEKTKRLRSVCRGFIPDVNNEMIYPTALAVNGRNMVVANQNVSLLGETGQLFAAVVRIPDYKNLC